MEENIKRMCLLVAMESEMNGYLDYFSKQSEKSSQYVFKKENLHKKHRVPLYRVIFLKNGGKKTTRILDIISTGKHTCGVDRVGTTVSTINTVLAIQELNPDIILNAGTCGGITRDRNVSIGDIFLPTKICYHDRRLSKKYESYARGNYQPMKIPEYMEKFISEWKTTPVKYGVFSSTNSFKNTEDDWKIIDEIKSEVNDMECAAIAETCDIFKVPFLPIKVVANVIQRTRGLDEEMVDFEENLETAVKKLNKFVIGLIEQFLNH